MRSKRFHVGQQFGRVVDDGLIVATFCRFVRLAGLGDQITRPDWLAQWRGRHIFNDRGEIAFRVASGPVDEDSRMAKHQVDAISGATVTATAVTRLVEFWFGPGGYQPFLEKLKNNPPTRQASGATGSES